MQPSSQGEQAGEKAQGDDRERLSYTTWRMEPAKFEVDGLLDEPKGRTNGRHGEPIEDFQRKGKQDQRPLMGPQAKGDQGVQDGTNEDANWVFVSADEFGFVGEHVGQASRETMLIFLRSSAVGREVGQLSSADPTRGAKRPTIRVGVPGCAGPLD